MKKIGVGSLIGLAVMVLLLALVLLNSRPLESFEEKLWDFRFQLRGSVTPPDDIVILLIDDKSIEKIGRWPWSREKMAEIVNRLSSTDPRVIALDIIFSEPGEGDPALERAIRDAGNVVLPMAFIFDKIGPVSSITPSEDFITSHSFAIVKIRDPEALKLYNPFRPSNVLLPSESFSSAASLAHINMNPDNDGTLRWETLAIEYLGDFYPSFSLKIAQLALGLDSGPLIYDVGRSVRIGARETTTDALGRSPVLYYGPDGSFPAFSVIDLLEGKIPKSTFRDKVVLIGAGALGIADIKITPMSVNMPGVEKNAHMIASLMEERFVKRAPYTMNLAILFFIGVPLSLGLSRMKAVTGTIVSFLALMVFMAMGYYLFVQKGIMINMAYPSVEIFLIYIGITAYSYASEERQAKKIKKMFYSYVTERVVDELIKHPEMAKLGGERRMVTILFSDIRGFTSFSENHPPEEVVAQLNEYLGAMTEVVFKHEGTLDKFIGDAIMAFWGAPIHQENHVELAIRCSLHMIDRLSELQEKWRSEGKNAFEIGIGLNTGEVLVGNIGIEGKKIDYTVIGDPVNLASRVESLTRSYDANLLLTEYTYNHASDLIEVTPLGAIKEPVSGSPRRPRLGHTTFSEIDRVKVKGKERSVVIYKLTGHPSPPKEESTRS